MTTKPATPMLLPAAVQLRLFLFNTLALLGMLLVSYEKGRRMKRHLRWWFFQQPIGRVGVMRKALYQPARFPGFFAMSWFFRRAVLLSGK